MDRFKLTVLTAAGFTLSICANIDPVAGSLAFAQSADKRYAIVFRQSGSLPADAERLVADAGGVITMLLPQIGVVAATSDDPGFASVVAADARVEAVGEDGELEVDTPAKEAVDQSAAEDHGLEEPTGTDPQPGTDNLYAQQWDKMRMNVSLTGSYAVQRGRAEVVVAVLDSGIEADHPDIAPNLDLARSRSFAVNPDNPAELESVFDDFRGHGTYMASTIAAPINTMGISGVAPGVTLVALKVLDKNNRFSSLAHVASALVYAAENRFDVANMSFSTTLSRTEAENRGRIKVLQRALNFARANGVTLVTATGNGNVDLNEGRAVITVPAELDGVIAASATGYYDHKPPYSSYGMGKTDVAAPGGDGRVTGCHGTPECGQTPIDHRGQPLFRGGGRILGAWSHLAISPISRNRPPVLECGTTGICAAGSDRERACTAAAGCYYYGWTTGTSISAAHASGVVALIISQYGDFSNSDARKPRLPPASVEAILQNAANNRSCPDPKVVVYAQPTQNRMSTCTGDAGYNSFFGKGIIDALKAVTIYND